MKINNFLVVLLIYYISTACSTLKIENNTKCYLDSNMLKNQILKNDKSIKKVELGTTSSDTLLNKDCNGFYFLYVYEWKNVKHNLNYVQIPIIIYDSNYYINMDFVNGVLVKESNLNNELYIIKDNLLKTFDENTTNKILERFKFGIVKESKGRFF